MPLFFCASMYVSEFMNIADWQQICLVHRKRCTGMKRGGKLLKKLEESRKVSANLRENEKYLRSRLENCSDILIRPMRLGDKHKVDCLMVYIEVAVSNMMLDDSALGKMINHFWEISPEDIQEFVRHNSLGIADVKKLENLIVRISYHKASDHRKKAFRKYEYANSDAILEMTDMRVRKGNRVDEIALNLETAGYLQ